MQVVNATGGSRTYPIPAGDPLALSANGERLYIGQIGGILEIDIDTGTSVRTIPLPADTVAGSIAFSRDGRFMFATTYQPYIPGQVAVVLVLIAGGLGVRSLFAGHAVGGICGVCALLVIGRGRPN